MWSTEREKTKTMLDTAAGFLLKYREDSTHVEQQTRTTRRFAHLIRVWLV